jgi:hypothetical protein
MFGLHTPTAPSMRVQVSNLISTLSSIFFSNPFSIYFSILVKTFCYMLVPKPDSSPDGLSKSKESSVKTSMANNTETVYDTIVQKLLHIWKLATNISKKQKQVCTDRLGCDLGLGSGSAIPLFQIFAKLNGATTTIDVASEWTEFDVKAALSAKMGRFLGDECYIVAPGGKAMNDGDVTKVGQLGVGKGGQVELRYRGWGGAKKAEAEAVLTSEPASAATQSAGVTTLGQSSKVDTLRGKMGLGTTEEEPTKVDSVQLETRADTPEEKVRAHPPHLMPSPTPTLPLSILLAVLSISTLHPCSSTQWPWSLFSSAP